MKCSVCGSDNLEGSAYCEDCGSRLAMTPAAPVMAAPAPPASEVPAPPVPVAEAPVAPAVATPAMPPTPFAPSEDGAPPAPYVPEAPAPVAPAPPVPFAPAAYAAPSAEMPAAVPVAGTVTCASCGAVNASGSAFCEDCGASLAAAPAAMPAAPAPMVAAPVASTIPSVAVARPRLVVAGSQVEFVLDKEIMLLGRKSPADSIFPEIDMTDVDPESYVSRRHGRITRQDAAFIYEDIGSSNGSFINGNKLTPKTQIELHDGDTLRLGRTEMCFRI